MSVILDKPITLCSIYKQSHFSLQLNMLKAYLKSYHQRIFFLGHFNGHKTSCGYSENKSGDKRIGDFITKRIICIMNDKSYTYIHPASGKVSSLDLSLCYQPLYLDFE